MHSISVVLPMAMLQQDGFISIQHSETKKKKNSAKYEFHYSRQILLSLDFEKIVKISQMSYIVEHNCPQTSANLCQ
jgi:hypothetical protein